MEEETRIFQLKRLIKILLEAKGNGTSMITLIIPGGSKVCDIASMLTKEYGTADNIKSHTNKLSVQSAIRSAQEKLKLYTKIPNNGLVICAGTALMDGKEKKITYDFETFRAVPNFLYRCDNKFHVEILESLFKEKQVFGFIVMDGHEAVYATLSGGHSEIKHHFSVELPNKHRRGGQSSVRFARLREEARHNYLRKLAEAATAVFITDNLPNVCGLVLAGSAQFKNKLVEDDLFDKRLKPIVLALVDINYGGERGLQQAINLTSDLLKAKDASLCCYGLNDTLYALRQGAVETVILWENCEDKVDEGSLVTDYLIDHVKDYGAKINLVTDKTPEGSQFVNGFGGVGGILRFKLEYPQEEKDDIEDDEDFI